MSKVALVTGGAGFIGSHLVDLLLQKGFFVKVIDNFLGGHKKNLAHNMQNKKFKLYDIDIRKLTIENEVFKDVDFVFHLAGIGDIVPSIDNPIEYFDINVQGTIRVLECCRAFKIKKIIYAASSSCYGIASTPTDEDHIIQPQYPYAMSKYQGEQAVMHWHKVYNLPVNSIRIFNAYGPRVRTTGAYGAVFGVFLKQKLAAQPLTIVGDGSQSRDFLFVTDVAQAFLAAAETNISGNIFNLGAGDPRTILSLAEMISDDIINIPKRPGEPDCTWANINKVSELLNWRPTIKFECGVKKMLNTIDDWKDAPLWDKKSIAHATKTWFKYLR